jgi:hypothetical protein
VDAVMKDKTMKNFKYNAYTDRDIFHPQFKDKTQMSSFANLTCKWLFFSQLREGVLPKFCAKISKYFFKRGRLHMKAAWS